jgi:hypothetical protein
VPAQTKKIDIKAAARSPTGGRRSSEERPFEFIPIDDATAYEVASYWRTVQVEIPKAL